MRAIFFVVKSLLLLVFLFWLFEKPGTATFVWDVYKVELPISLFIIGAILSTLVVYNFLKFWNFIFNFPLRFSERRREKKQKESIRLLTETLTALYSHNTKLATYKAEQLHQYIKNSSLEKIILSEVYKLGGNHDQALLIYDRMISDKSTAFLGFYGLAQHSKSKMHYEEALEYANRAYEYQPDSGAILEMLYDLNMRLDNYKKAIEILSKVKSNHLIDAERKDELEAIAWLKIAQEAENERYFNLAMRDYMSSHEKNPALIPSAVNAARLLINEGKNAKAQKIIEDTWALNEHPELAELFIKATDGKTPTERVQKAQILLNLKNHSLEGHLAVVKTSIEAQLWSKARHHLEIATQLNNGMSPRMFEFRALIAEGDKTEIIHIRKWLQQIIVSPKEPSWTCKKCGHQHSQWLDICDHCHALGGIEWTVPHDIGDKYKYDFLEDNIFENENLIMLKS